MLDNFIKECDISEEVLNKFKTLLPQEIISIWSEQGLGSFMDGYLKFINPEDYSPLLKDSYFMADEAIPFMVTAFGDVITWEKNQYIGIVMYRYGKNEIMIKTPKLFFRLLNDSGFTKRFFSLDLYREAVEKIGKPAYDECFGFYPILALGGGESVDHIKISKTREHIALITSLVGGIM